MIINRSKFIRLWNNLTPGLGEPDSVLWTLEKAGEIKPSRWFIKVKPLRDRSFDEDPRTSEGITYWEWCKTTLTGTVACYSTSDELQEEWWGFENHEDIIIWKLKWEGY